MIEEETNTAEHDSSHRKGRWLVIGLWCFVCAWLVISLLVSIVGALFYGDGPATNAATVDVPAETRGVANASSVE